MTDEGNGETIMAEKLPEVINRKADELLEWAEGEDVIHGLLSLLPAGGFLDALLFKRMEKSARQRLEELHLKFANDLSKLDESKVDKEYLKSEEFDVLLMKVVAKTIWEHSEEQRNYFRQLLLNSVTVDFSKNPLKETLLGIIGDLSPAHVKVLHAFAEGQLKDDSGFSLPSRAYQVVEGLSELDAEAIGDDLIKKGLLHIRTFDNMESIEIAGIGRSLLNFIAAPAV